MRRDATVYSVVILVCMSVQTILFSLLPTLEIFLFISGNVKNQGGNMNSGHNVFVFSGAERNISFC